MKNQTIETKFQINDLCKRKMDVDTEEKITLMQVMEIDTNTCYAGTQVFYKCRILFLSKTRDPEKPWRIGHSVSKDPKQMGWETYREDELKKAPTSIVGLIPTDYD